VKGRDDVWDVVRSRAAENSVGFVGGGVLGSFFMLGTIRKFDGAGVKVGVGGLYLATPKWSGGLLRRRAAVKE
jgi:hypothetical protein